MADGSDLTASGSNGLFTGSVRVSLGVAVALLGTILAAWGSVMIPRRPVMGNVVAGAGGLACQLLAMRLAPFYAISPLAGMIVVWTDLIQERESGGGGRRVRPLAIAGVVTGCGVAALAAAIAERRANENGGGKDERNREIVLTSVPFALVGMLVWSFRFDPPPVEAEAEETGEKEKEKESGKEEKPVEPPSRRRRIVEFMECAYPGIVGGMTNLTLKTVVVDAFPPRDTDAWLMAGSCVCFALVQFTSYNVALMKHPPTLVNSIYVPALVACTSCASGVVLGEFESLDRDEFLITLIGLFLACWGASAAETST